MTSRGVSDKRDGRGPARGETPRDGVPALTVFRGSFETKIDTRVKSVLLDVYVGLPKGSIYLSDFCPVGFQFSCRTQIKARIKLAFLSLLLTETNTNICGVSCDYSTFIVVVTKCNQLSV